MCGVGRDGLSARTIAIAARGFGFRVRAYSIELSDMKSVQLPAIAHWGFNHFVVVEKWSPASVEIVDPGCGRRRLTTEEFSHSFTGVILTFEPGANFTRTRGRTAPYWLRYLKSMMMTRSAVTILTQILVTSAALQLLGLVMPLVTKLLVDQVLPFKITNVLGILGIAMVIALLAQMIMGYLRSVLLIYLRGRLDSQLMENFFEHLLTLPFTFFQQRTTGDLLMRLTSNSRIREMLTNQTLSVLLDGSFVLVYLTILLIISPILGGVVVSLGLLQILLVFGTRRRVRNLAQRDLSAMADEQGYLIEAMKGIGMLKASGAEDVAFDRWSNLFCIQINVSIERSHLAAIIDTALGTIRSLSPLLLLWVGGLLVLNGSMSLGTMLAMNTLAVSFMAPLTMLVASAEQLQMVGSQLERIADVLDAEPEQLGQNELLSPRLSGSIEARNVSFRYAPEGPLVVKNISFRVQAGQKIALTGPTGSGKSTLAMLLLGLYQPTEGEVFYDGIPLRQFNYRALRNQVGVVLQDPFVFSGSLRQNIALSNPSLSLEEIAEVAHLAGLHNEISVMPMGYETVVSEGGTTLSGGQRQRLSIARALVNRPSIIVLDEATSQLDVRTESEVHQNLSELSCTRVVIAHRLSTIRNADQILVLEDGSIIEQGTHEQLMERGGHYATAVRSQLEREPLDRGLQCDNQSDQCVQGGYS